ncbi:MAG: hypothetical protein WBA74_02350 [Cyclobacteriaceae bacterium]
MPKTSHIKKFQLSELTQRDFREIQLIAKKNNGEPYHLDYIRKVCKGKRSNFAIEKAAKEYYEKLVAFRASFLKGLSK